MNERLRELQAIEHLVGLGYEVRFLSDVWFKDDEGEEVNLDAVRKEIAELEKEYVPGADWRKNDS